MYIDGTEMETLLKHHGRVPTYDEYMALRFGSIGFGFLLSLSEYVAAVITRKKKVLMAIIGLPAARNCRMLFESRLSGRIYIGLQCSSPSCEFKEKSSY
jgi:hypothetical protein